jgi:hypothetical protein
VNAAGRGPLAALFDGRQVSQPVVCLHTWGRYPFQHLGRESLYGRCGGTTLAGIYEAFLRDFPIDWLQVRQECSGGTHWDAQGLPLSPDIEAYPEPPAARYPDPLDFTSVDNLYDACPARHILENGDFDHVRVLRARLGRGLTIAPNIGGPNGELGASFDEHMIAALERPDDVREALVAACRGRVFSIVKAAAACGADAFIFSLGYGGACDLVSPSAQRRMCLEAWQELFAQVRRIGVRPIGYFLGNVTPCLDLIRESGVDGVMIEESKKGFVLDPVAIRRALPERIVLFGNTDSQLLRFGTSAEIREAVKRQARASDQGPFVHINGSPICPDTPPDSIRAFLDAARTA